MIDRRTWLLLAQRLAKIKTAGAVESVTLVFDEYDQARIA